MPKNDVITKIITEENIINNIDFFDGRIREPPRAIPVNMELNKAIKNKFSLCIEIKTGNK